MTVSEVMREVKKDVLFYEESGGGVTFSGGEVFLQEKFLISLLEECRKDDIHTCIDTTGYTSKDIIKEVILLCDLFLFDIKLIDEDLHIRYCGVSNKKIFDNFRTIYESGTDINIRFPVIPGITDTSDNLEKMVQFASEFEGIKMELLPYHRVGADKYRRLGMEYLMGDAERPSADRMKELTEYFRESGIDAATGG